MLWQSDPVVVTGKHQNALAEINYRYLRNQGIPVARRLTGGGTVFHDAGNINFTFIGYGEPGRLVNFAGYIDIVAQFLNTLGIVANRGPKNEILVNGLKISGNAEHIFKNSVLHHGTLLIQSDLDRLRKSIQPAGGRYTDKAVQSNRSHVMNLADWMNPTMTPEEFRKCMMAFMMNQFQGRQFKPDATMQLAIEKLAVEKYSSWEWIFGWSPDYTFENTWQISALKISIHFTVHRGIIQQCLLHSDVLTSPVIQKLHKSLQGIPHRESNIKNALIQSGLHTMLNDAEFDELILAFF